MALDAGRVERAGGRDVGRLLMTSHVVDATGGPNTREGVSSSASVMSLTKRRCAVREGMPRETRGTTTEE